MTIDATGCRKEIASKIVSKGADYILAVKGNQGNLEADMERTVRFCRPAEEWVEEDFGHGRIESRKCSLYRYLSFIEHAAQWEHLKAAVKTESRRYIKPEGREETETRYYITGSGGNAETIGRAVRSRWEIENSLHRVLDVSFREDESRKREGYAAQNFSMIPFQRFTYSL